MQPTGVPLIGGSNPGPATWAPLPAPKVSRPGFEPPTVNCTSAALPLDRRLCDKRYASPLLVAFRAKTFDPPPHPTLKKVISSFRG